MDVARPAGGRGGPRGDRYSRATAPAVGSAASRSPRLGGEQPVGAEQGQAQVAAFLGRGQVIDPDGAGDVWEVPVRDPAVLRQLNFEQPALRP